MNPRHVTAQRSLTVRPRLPEPIRGLARLADNLRWTWHAPTRELFGRIDPSGPPPPERDPRRVLADASAQRLDELASDDDFVEQVRRAVSDLEGATTSSGAFGHRIGYFSPEYGITESLPQYSGGLGVLAADHLKAAGDLGLPMVAVGLFYRHGYFHQRLTVDGWQEEYFEDHDPHALPLSEATTEPVELALGGRTIALRVWMLEVGPVPLYLLDADLIENPPDLRLVTDRLYGGDVEHRLRQELVLGVGGVRALAAVGATPEVFHTNEGHAGFLGLERIRTLVVDGGLDFEAAVQQVRASSVFTTHTPVPAGIDRFPKALMEEYFSGWADECGVPLEVLMDLGHEPEEAPDSPFNMAAMGMRLARHRNGVSRSHGRTSRSMFAPLWPGLPEDEVPIGHVTNGVHAATWTSPEMAGSTGAEDPTHIAAARGAAAERLVAAVRGRLWSRGVASGRSPSELRWTRTALDPALPTIGFARRMATHKRAALLLEQPDRLRALISDPRQPVQFVFAGKAHPDDEAGKETIRRLVAFASEPANRQRFVFLEDYDIALARNLVQGVDVWLNTPLPPLEASGTSGMKAALNGALNLSVLDGWWEEFFDPGTGPHGVPNGWAISAATGSTDRQRAEMDSNSLYEILEHQVLPLFHGTADVDHSWHDMVRTSLDSLGPRVTARRMVEEYVEQMYTPAARMGSTLAADGHAGARELASFLRRVDQRWDRVAVLQVEMDESLGDLGGHRSLRAEVDLGGLSPEEVQVQGLAGHLGAGGEIENPEVFQMELAGSGHGGSSTWVVEVPLERAGRMGATVRVLPHHDHLGAASAAGTDTAALDLGLVVWA